ncbi:MAG: cation:proton antiporter [Terriglobia bacterium]
MNTTAVLAALGGLLLLAFVAHHLFDLTRIPDILVLTGVGVVLGPLTGIVHMDQYRGLTHTLGTLALVLILFEGGLGLRIRETLKHLPAGVLLSAGAYFLTIVFVAFGAHWLLHFPWLVSTLTGAALGCASGSVALPILQQLGASQDLAVPLVLEAALGDVFGVTTVSVLLGFLQGSQHLVGTVILHEGLLMLASVVVSVLAGAAWSRLARKLSEERFWQSLTFSFVLLLYAGTQSVLHNGLLAVLTFGLTLANRGGFNLLAADEASEPEQDAEEHHVEIRQFHSELAFLVRTFFFVLLGAVVEFSGIRGNLWLVVVTVIALIVARAVGLLITMPVWHGIDRREKEVAFWLLPRGLITAVLAIQVYDAGGGAFRFLPGLAFVIILITNGLVVVGTWRTYRAASI